MTEMFLKVVLHDVSASHDHLRYIGQIPKIGNVFPAKRQKSPADRPGLSMVRRYGVQASTDAR
jgi:hypothetical protein